MTPQPGEALRLIGVAQERLRHITDHNADVPAAREVRWAMTDLDAAAAALAAPVAGEGLREAAEFAVDRMARFLWDGDTNDGGDDDLVIAAHDRFRTALAANQPVAERLDPYRNANEHERQSMAGTHNFDPHCPFCFLAHFDAETRAALAANQPVAEERTTHGRHCPCSACARQDWTDPNLAHCGMHGPSCPAVYAPVVEERNMSDGLREALLELRRHDLADGPCWCSTEPNKSNGWRHVKACRDARTAIRVPGLPSSFPVGSPDQPVAEERT